MTEDYKKIILTGKIYIKYIDDESPIKGDLRLFLHNDSIATFQGDYECDSYSGYLKAEVFDGKFWQLVDLDEFLENRENRYGKRQRPIDTAYFCIELLEKSVEGIEIFRTYRGHFTSQEYVKEERITKANRNRKK